MLNLRFRRWAHAGALLACVVVGPASNLRAADTTTTVQSHLYDGTARAGEAELAGAVERDPADPNLAFGLGTVRFVRAIEHLGQSLYRYGLRSPVVGVPILRMPVPVNDDPDHLTYDGFRGILRDLVDDLKSADTALGKVDDRPARLALDPSKIRLDITGDGGKRDDERLWTIISGMTPAIGRSTDTMIVLDNADVAWLRGYSHLVMGCTEWVLAHDFHEMFDESFSLFFPRPSASEAALRDEDRKRTDLIGAPRGDIAIADAIALVHLLHWPVAEPARTAAARDHLLQVIAMSRVSWKAVLARTDDERHWIPGPGQKGIIPLPVTLERIGAWLEVLDEGQAVLEGRKLVPHWRFTRGIDLARAFKEPRTFDLVLWLTGPGARPYLANGEVISSQSWGQLLRAFEGNFLTYAFWFN